MTEPVYVTKDEVKEMIVKALEEYTEKLTETLQLHGQAVREEFDTVLEHTVKYGDPVALQANKGMFICAEEGGPVEEKDPFNLTGRLNAALWESFKIHRGQQ